jgi:hypothetical protein
MYIYFRNITIKLFFLRITFFIVITLCFYLYKNGLGDYAFVLAFLLVICSVFPITGLKIEESSFIIKQYYCFGLFHRTWTFFKGDDITLHSFDLGFNDGGYLYTDSLWDILIAFTPIPTRSVNRFAIRSKNVEFKRGKNETFQRRANFN